MHSESMTKPTTSNRWEQLLRYRYIEIIALWEGRLTTRHLCQVFGIGRQQASKDINNYKRSVGPGNLEYDSVKKGYVTSTSFTPRLSRGEAEEYLEIISRQSDMQQILGRLPDSFTATEVLSIPNRQIPPKILRPLISAAKDHLRLEVDYVSLNQPDREGRIIAPHTLIWTGLRWHLRGWCEKNQDYRDFVLSRFRGVPEPLNTSKHTVTEDVGWNTLIELVLAPDPRLSSDQQEIVAHDYSMKEGQWRLTTRATLLPYLLRILGIDSSKLEQSPRAQQLTILNKEQLTQWLFLTDLQ